MENLPQIGSDQDASVGGGNSGVGGSTGVTCMYLGVRYAVGSSFWSADGCSMCSCSSDGQQILCTQMACAVGGGSSNGGATSVGCVCTGPSPAAPSVQCWDGSVAGPECVTNATGSCAWTVTTCPPQPGAGGTTGAGGTAGVGGTTGVTCIYNGVNYPTGTIPANTCCICGSDGSVSCANNTACGNKGTGGSTGVGGSTSVTCVYNNANYAVGASFKSSDGCNSCTCTSNGIACTELACAAGGSSSVGGATGTSGCVTAADCKGALPALCEQCTDGSSGCAHYVCNSGSCEIAYCGTVGCTYESVDYAAGSSFKSTDGCNTCSCSATGQVTCTTLPCPISGTGGASSAGGSGQGGSSSCPAIPLVMPKCTNGTAILQRDPTTGCATGYVCPTCPAINLPNITCANYQLVTSSTTGCPTGYVCPIADAGACPPIALVVPACANASAVLKYDASGCATGYVCP